MSQRLIDAGWQKTERGYWIDPELPQKSSQTERQALRMQDEKERFAKGLPVFRMSSCKAGYGFTIYRYPNRKEKAPRVFRHEDSEVTRQAMELLSKDENAKMELEGKEQAILNFSTSFQFPRMLVVKDKYSATYYHVPTIEKLKQACLYILEERQKEGCYPEAEDSQPTPPELTEEQIAALPEGEIKKLAQEQHARYHDSLRYHEEAQIETKAIKNALATKDGLLAFSVLLERASYEYEGFEILNFSQVPVV